MRLKPLLFAAVCSAGILASDLRAETISYFTGNITTSSLTELGRPSRNNQPQSWTGIEAYPGVLSTTTATTYYYNVYNFSASLFAGAPFVDVSFTDELANGLLFISAYANTYNPANRLTNWLGDLGFNSAAYGPNSLDFEFVLPSNSSLVLVVTTTGGGTSGTNNPFDVAVNAYADTLFNDPAPVPEPSTLLLGGTGLLGLVGAVRRRLTA